MTTLLKRKPISRFCRLGVICVFSLYSQATAQPYDKLNLLPGYKAQVYYSAGVENKATRMASQLNSVMSFYNDRIHFTPVVTLLILSPDDWSQYTDFPMYGMPHYTSNKTLVVASQDNAFWRSFIPALDKLPVEIADAIRQTYTDHCGGLTMEPFFDLLAIHELGHAYHIQGGLVMQRKWMGELFANILLHSYIAEKEPTLLDALTIFPTMVVSTTRVSSLKYTSLNDLEAHYDELGKLFPQNYGWYQCRWHMAAATIYDEGGVKVFENLWNTLKTQRDSLDNSTFAALLARQVHQSVADVMLKWDE